jgi:hypothetical protein
LESKTTEVLVIREEKVVSKAEETRVIVSLANHSHILDRNATDVRDGLRLQDIAFCASRVNGEAKSVC